MLTHCLAAIDPPRECNFESGRGGYDQLSTLDSYMACHSNAAAAHLVAMHVQMDLICCRQQVPHSCALLQGKYLVQGAAGSVLGRMLIQYAKHIGIKTINIVRRQEQIQELKDLG